MRCNVWKNVFSKRNQYRLVFEEKLSSCSETYWHLLDRWFWYYFLIQFLNNVTYLNFVNCIILDYERRRNFHTNFNELSPLLPFALMLILSTLIFMLIFFRQWPGLVAAIVAGCLTSVSIYFLLLSLKQEKLVYE